MSAASAPEYLCFSVPSAMVSSGAFVLCTVAIGCAIAFLISLCKILFDLYQSCMPRMVILLLILSFTFAAIPVAVFAVSWRDDGMNGKGQ